MQNLSPPIKDYFRMHISFISCQFFLRTLLVILRNFRALIQRRKEKSLVVHTFIHWNTTLDIYFLLRLSKKCPKFPKSTILPGPILKISIFSCSLQKIGQIGTFLDSTKNMDKIQANRLPVKSPSGASKYNNEHPVIWHLLI